VNVLRELRSYYEQKYGISVEIAPELPVSFSDTYDSMRGQHHAEKLIASLKHRYSTLKGERVYIAFVSQDMYSSTNGGAYSYAFADKKHAVISDGRIGAFGDHNLLPLLRKLATREIALLLFKQPLSNDPRSVLFSGLNGPDDLRNMSDDF